MKHIVPALAALAFLLTPLAASADTLSACKANYPKAKSITPVLSVTEVGNDYFVTANGKRFKARFEEDNYASFLTAIGGGKVTLYADTQGNLYGPNIAGNDSLLTAEERACIRF
ncbi:MAG: hypothetical protein DI628_07085 [Blastochloris viridis]|uniref:Uncharacterized protein n=1 Tax=Blastochloris viridis TaxID=1079 RepID=A0A6N4RC77_BLAVI|nr:MAG: hypothetical protein DI628_07085 [Blastochloris viridis]